MGDRLQYLWESYVGELGFDLRPDVIRAVRGLAPGLVELQQYSGFLSARDFRRSLLCREGITLDRTIRPERMTRFQVVGIARPLGQPGHRLDGKRGLPDLRTSDAANDANCELHTFRTPAQRKAADGTALHRVGHHTPR